MGRPREFDLDTALDGAMHIFWRQGYQGTTLPDLLTAMGLTRGSFYKAFKDKETAYLQALDQYDQAVVSKTVETLAQCDHATAAECLLQLFETPSGPRKGCFICNAMVELAADNAAVAQKANRMANRLQTAIRDVLDRYGVLSSDRQRSETAHVVLHLYFGFQAIGKSADSSGNWAEYLAELTQER